MQSYPIIVEYGTPQYVECVRLRDLVLRKPLGLSFTEDQLASEFNSIHIALVNIELEVIACLVVKPLSDQLAKIRQVAVDPDYQRKGLGKRMSLFAEQYLRNQGYQSIELSARTEAISFYQNQGYKTVGSTYTEIGIDHQKMTKSIV